MIELLQAEYIKQKRKFFAVFFVLVVLNVFFTIKTIQNIWGEKYRFDIFSVYHSLYGTVFIISYLAIGLFALNLLYSEFKNDMMKQLLTCPITNLEFIMVKLFATYLFSETVMLINVVQMSVIVWLKDIPFTKDDLIFIVLMAVVDGFLLFLSILPLFIVFICCKQNIILSVVAVIVYAVTLVLASIEVVHIDIQGYLHPLMNIVFVHNYILYKHIEIADYGIMEDAVKNINISLAILSIVLYTAISLTLIVFVFRKIRK